MLSNGPKRLKKGQPRVKRGPTTVTCSASSRGDCWNLFGGFWCLFRAFLRTRRKMGKQKAKTAQTSPETVKKRSASSTGDSWSNLGRFLGHFWIFCQPIPRVQLCKKIRPRTTCRSFLRVVENLPQMFEIRRRPPLAGRRHPPPRPGTGQRAARWHRCAEAVAVASRPPWCVFVLLLSSLPPCLSCFCARWPSLIGPLGALLGKFAPGICCRRCFLLTTSGKSSNTNIEQTHQNNRHERLGPKCIASSASPCHADSTDVLSNPWLESAILHFFAIC